MSTAGAKAVHGHTTKKWYFWKGKPDGAEGVDNLLIFGGSVYPELSEDVCSLLGLTPGNIDLGRCADFSYHGLTRATRIALSLYPLAAEQPIYESCIACSALLWKEALVLKNSQVSGHDE